MNEEADELLKLEIALREVSIRLREFTNRISFVNDDYADILKLASQIAAIQKSQNLPILLQCETRKAPSKYMVQMNGRIGYPENLLVVRAFDPENPALGILTALPTAGWLADGSEVSQIPSRTLELLARSIRYVSTKREGTPTYTNPLPKGDVMKLYGIRETTFKKWLKSGKIPHIDNEKRTIRLELSEYKRLTGA